VKKAAAGFRRGFRFTALVAVSLENGVPTVLSRQRLELVETFSFKFSKSMGVRNGTDVNKPDS
jgi:hypothetical protein